MDRAVLGTTAVIAASSLINVALASPCDAVEIYFNLPDYAQDSIPTKPENGAKYVAFFYNVKRTKVKITVPGGTCAMGQCGGPSSAGPSGCQCDAQCTSLGDCCKDFQSSCELGKNMAGDVTVLNKAKGTGAMISVFSVSSNKKSCNGRCKLPALDGSCMCDDRCHFRGDCCADKVKFCPSSDRNANACKCSGQTNTNLPTGQQGGAQCDSDNDNPKGKWCYTNPGLCSDGKPSQALAGQEWSLLACAASAPGAGGGGNAGTTGCKCSPNLVNEAGAGRADCASVDAGGAWCYTEPGVCDDGVNSAALPGKQWSYKACVGGGGGGGGTIAVPAAWTCPKNTYNAKDTCDCNCGAPDPDCKIAGIRLTGCLQNQVCDNAGKCAAAAGPGTGNPGNGNGQPVQGASLGCTAASPTNAVGTRRNLFNMPLIVGGKDVNPPFKQLHLVSLQQRSGFHFCGGTLIYDGTWVLTAAHCTQGAQGDGVPPQLGQVVMHRHDFRKPLAAEGATAFKAYKVFNHPNYNPDKTSSDISLIQLASPNNPNQPMSRSEVPTNMLNNIVKLDDGSFAKPDQLVTVAGWGALRSDGPSPPIAQQVTVEYIANDKCQLQAGQPGRPNQYRGLIDGTMLCAGQKNGAPGKDSCQGDSGGPLTTSCVINGTPRAVLVGVVSWGFGCALANLPGVYARVHNFIGWMTTVIKANPNSFNG